MVTLWNYGKTAGACVKLKLAGYASELYYYSMECYLPYRGNYQLFKEIRALRLVESSLLYIHNVHEWSYSAECYVKSASPCKSNEVYV